MNLIRALGIGAVSLLAIGGWRYFSNLQKLSQLPSKQQTLTILQDVRKQFYPLLIKIADYVARELIPKGINPDDNQKFIMENPNFKSQIQALNDKIYKVFSEEEVRQATEVNYKEDGDIIKQKHEFREQYKKALLGIRPQQQMTASRKISKPKVLQSIKQILEDKIERLQSLKVKDMEQKDQRLILQGDVQQDERITKQKIKQKLGLSAKDSIDIFHFAVARYTQEDQAFKKQYDQILKDYSLRVRALIPK